MEIDPYPPGLLSREFFPIDLGRYVMEERWDISVPGCPMIRSPFNPHIGPAGNLYVRQLVMTAAEYMRAGRALKRQ